MEYEKVAVSLEISQARARISDLLLEIDRITLQANPQIKAEYASKIGYLENDLLKWQLAARRARRRCTLAQAKANAGQTISSDEFEVQLDAELSEWETLLAQSTSEFLRTIELVSGSKPLSPMEARELKHLHRELIMRLHPDLHPDQSEDAARFFMVAQSAYERGDLDMLRSILVATEGMNCGYPDASQLSEAEAATALAAIGAGSIIAAADAAGASLSVPMPFQNRIVLIEHARIAGTARIRDIDKISESLAMGAALSLEREPGNLADCWAIKVASGGSPIGYVPADCNEILARLMDGGKALSASLTGKETTGKWTRLYMEVSLDD